MDDVSCRRELVDGGRRFDPRHALFRDRLGVGERRACGLDSQEHQRRERSDSADRSKKYECRQYHGRPAGELVWRAPCVCAQIHILSGEHAVVGIPQIPLAPQHQPNGEQHRRVHPREPLREERYEGANHDQDEPVECNRSQ